MARRSLVPRVGEGDGRLRTLSGCGSFFDVDPGWASFLGQPGAIGCNAVGVGGEGVRSAYSYSYSYSSE
jgi:hypothetical protein